MKGTISRLTTLRSTAATTFSCLALLGLSLALVGCCTKATSINTPATLVLRDGSGSFATKSVNLEGVLNLPKTTATVGIVNVGGSPFLHGFGGNTFVGANAGNLTTKGTSNVAIGTDALSAQTGGDFNTAIGTAALSAEIRGDFNTAIGWNALPQHTTGRSNIAIGESAGANIERGSYNIDIGTYPERDESNTIRIGSRRADVAQQHTFIAGIYNGEANAASALPVFVDASGQLGTMKSSIRFKENVETMGDASGGLMQLRPVTFHYKSAYDDGSNLLQYGLIAEEVAKVYPGLVQYDDDGQPLAVRYQFVDAMLLNEAQKQHAKIAAQEAEIAGLRAQLAEQRRLADAQETRIAKLEALIGRP